jgi:predicted transcriptional regulator
MKVNDILSNTNFELLSNESGLNLDVKSFFASDLLSHVMGNAGEGSALITVLNNINVLGVASLLDMSCVIFSHGVKVSDEIISKSNELGIPLLRTRLNTVSTILILDKIGL